MLRTNQIFKDILCWGKINNLWKGKNEKGLTWRRKWRGSKGSGNYHTEDEAE